MHVYLIVQIRKSLAHCIGLSVLKDKSGLADTLGRLDLRLEAGREAVLREELLIMPDLLLCLLGLLRSLDWTLLLGG